MTRYDKRCITMATVLACVLCVGCNQRDITRDAATDAHDGDRFLSVVVSIVPQAYFVERITGPLASVEVLAPPDHVAETHQVTPRQMDILSRADLYFRIGMPFETSLVPRLVDTCPQLTVVDTRDGVPMLGVACTHDHGDDGGHHHHDGDDPHIWLDPMRVKIQARAMASALTAAAPEHADVFIANLQAFEADLDALHQQLQTLLAPARGKTIYVYHPAFGYLADAYGFVQQGIEVEGKSPGSKRLYALIDEIKQARVRTIFDQPQFADGSVRVIADEAGVDVTPLDGLMTDYLSGMEELGRVIAASFE